MGKNYAIAPGGLLAIVVFAAAMIEPAPGYAQQPPPGYPQPPPQYTPPPPGYPQPPPPQQYTPPPQQQYSPPQQQQPYSPPPPGYPQPPPSYQQPPPQATPDYTQPPPQRYPPPPPAYAPYPPPGYAPAAATTHAQQQGIQYHPFRMYLSGGYTITEGAVKDSLHDGGNVGLGFLFFPSRDFPLGLRVDGSYSNFNQSLGSLANASNITGTNVVSGYTEVYGGDIDAELALNMGSKVKEYFFGGFGWYREHSVFKSVTYEQGLICYFYCTPGYVPVYYTSATNTSDWMKAWNAGIGFEFALTDPATFFVEARYLRYVQGPGGSANTAFVPIRVGIRF